jgi:hypothetical protein
LLNFNTINQHTLSTNAIPADELSLMGEISVLSAAMRKNNRYHSLSMQLTNSSLNDCFLAAVDPC